MKNQPIVCFIMNNIHKIRDKKNRYAFLVRTRDRCDISQQTLPPLLYEKDIDVYWVDGSVTEEGIKFAQTAYRDAPGLCEVHTNITYSPDGRLKSYLYGIRLLIQEGYDYIGMLENDILLSPGWFQSLCELYQKGARDGLRVGCVSARCIADRILVPRDNYAVMANVGAGMTMMKQETYLMLAQDESHAALDNVQFKMSAIRQTFADYTGVMYPVNWRMKNDMESGKFPPGTVLDWLYSNDWWWEVILAKNGMVALAPTPTMARNIDLEGSEDPYAETATKADPNFDWNGFIQKLNTQAALQAEKKIA